MNPWQPEDATKLLNFVNQLSDAMHVHGKVSKLTSHCVLPLLTMFVQPTCMHSLHLIHSSILHIKVVSIDASPCVADNSWEGVGWHNNCKWWDMHAYNTSKVDSFCNMYTYR